MGRKKSMPRERRFFSKESVWWLFKEMMSFYETGNRMGEMEGDGRNIYIYVFIFEAKPYRHCRHVPRSDALQNTRAKNCSRSPTWPHWRERYFLLRVTLILFLIFCKENNTPRINKQEIWRNLFFCLMRFNSLFLHFFVLHIPKAYAILNMFWRKRYV